ncbi:hypothetical protein B0J13DRAFT_133587 [Dactylonectria estremocensis]|uniref:Uncharacterized protein n=1 Tax=Dactylonectria estremocensis TaxID=1079267 RepID=A0A9P9E0U6_9HYPO|nr:hypothetical protein B0J13DRAFT_133587 [Dactylonectria estremocensis]
MESRMQKEVAGKAEGSFRVTVLVLPTIPVEGAVYHDLPGRIEDDDIGLLKDVPECYDINPQTGHFKLHAGYEDAGPSVTERQFPVVFFDGLDFARNSSVACCTPTISMPLI